MSNQEKAIIAASISGTSPASSYFADICRAQLLNLDHSIHMDWAGVYLAGQNVVGKPQLTPIVIYPERQESKDLPSKLIYQGKYFESDLDISLTKRARQIALPLVDQGEILGVLLVVRDHRQWTDKEFRLMESTAKVLSLSRKLDLNYTSSKTESIYLKIEKEKQQQYIGDLLHQLRNPVTALRTFTRLLLKQINPQGIHKQALQGITRESERIAELLTDLPSNEHSLNTHKKLPLLAQGAQLTLENISLDSVLSPLIDSFSLVAQEKGLDLQFQIKDNSIYIRANSRALIEVISNLIDNAIKYTPSPGRILITTETQDKWIKIMVIDSGHGIPIEEQHRIFERHFRGEKTEQIIPGSGLGLAIAKELLEQMNGKIELLSNHQGTDGGGSTFIIWLLSSPLTGNSSKD